MDVAAPNIAKLKHGLHHLGRGRDVGDVLMNRGLLCGNRNPYQQNKKERCGNLRSAADPKRAIRGIQSHGRECSTVILGEWRHGSKRPWSSEELSKDFR